MLYNPAGQGIGGGVSVNNPAFRNVGSMKNHGIDLMITNKTAITKNLSLNTQLTFTTYNNTITAINGTQQFFDFNSPTNEANRIGQNATRNFVGEAFKYFLRLPGYWYCSKQMQKQLHGTRLVPDQADLNMLISMAIKKLMLMIVRL